MIFTMFFLEGRYKDIYEKRSAQETTPDEFEDMLSMMPFETRGMLSMMPFGPPNKQRGF